MAEEEEQFVFEEPEDEMEVHPFADEDPIAVAEEEPKQDEEPEEEEEEEIIPIRRKKVKKQIIFSGSPLRPDIK